MQKGRLLAGLLLYIQNNSFREIVSQICGEASGFISISYEIIFVCRGLTRFFARPGLKAGASTKRCLAPLPVRLVKTFPFPPFASKRALLSKRFVQDDIA
jgi:hypothetical protein